MTINCSINNSLPHRYWEVSPFPKCQRLHETWSDWRGGRSNLFAPMVLFRNSGAYDLAHG